MEFSSAFKGLNVIHTFSDDGPRDYLNMLETYM